MILLPEYHQRYGPWAVVAGASEGIGQAYARVLAERGFNLLTLARRAGPLEEEADLLRRRYRVEVRPTVLDLGSENLQAEFTALIQDLDIGLLVYNACVSTIGPFADADMDIHLKTLDVNCRGPVILSHIMAPRLLERGRGGIILMSSMSGFQGSALVSCYAATKAFNINLAQGLWAELSPKGVDVLACVAGATSTPGFENNTPQEKRGKAFPMTAEPVAREGLDALGKRPVHITGRLNRTVDRLTSLLGRTGRTRFFSKATQDIYGT